MSAAKGIELQALVTLSLDGGTYAPGEWIVLPAGQQARADELLRYGLVQVAPARRRKAATK